jgi:hypothetical protein
VFGPFRSATEDMLVVLPFAGYASLLLVFRLRDSGWRNAAVLRATAWGVLVVLATDVLSSPHGLTKMGLASAWPS